MEKTIEERVSILESQMAGFMRATLEAAKALIGNPYAKAMLPKDVKEKLETYVKESAVV